MFQDFYEFFSLFAPKEVKDCMYEKKINFVQILVTLNFKPIKSTPLFD